MLKVYLRCVSVCSGITNIDFSTKPNHKQRCDHNCARKQQFTFSNQYASSVFLRNDLYFVFSFLILQIQATVGGRTWDINTGTSVSVQKTFYSLVKQLKLCLRIDPLFYSCLNTLWCPIVFVLIMDRPFVLAVNSL